MSWFRLDDQGAFHEKVLKAGNEAYGAWCRAGQWASAQLTEGRIPRVTALLIARPNVWERLVGAGLCETASDGWQIHDYLDWNPSTQNVIDKKAQRSEAGRKGGLRSAASRRPTDSQTNEAKGQANASADAPGGVQANGQAGASSIVQTKLKQRATPSRPLPVPRSDPPVGPPTKQNEAIARKPEPEIPIPPDFAVSPELEAICRRENLANPHAVLPDFRDWAEENQVKKARWEATFRRWMRNKITAEKYPPWNEIDPLRTTSEPVAVTPEQVERRRATNATIQAGLAEMDARLNGVAR